MAEEKKTEKPAAEKEKKGGKGQDILKSILIRIFNKGKKPAARFLARFILTPEQRIKVARNEDPIDTAAMVLAWVTPHEGLWELTDDVLQDFVHEAVVACQEMVAAGNETAPLTTGVDAPRQLRRLQAAMIGIPKPKQDDFYFWYTDLTDIQKKMFLLLVADLPDDKLPSLVQETADDLDAALMFTNPAAPPATPKLDAIQLEQTVRRNDPDLFGFIQDFLEVLERSSGRDRTADFWTAASLKVSSIDGLKTFVEMDEDLLIRRLGLDKPSIRERISSWYSDGKNKAGELIGETSGTLNRLNNEVKTKIVTKVEQLDNSAAAQSLQQQSADARQRMRDKLEARKGK